MVIVRLAVYLPLLAPVIAALTARHLAARMPPRLATWLLTAMAVVLGGVSRAALTATALGQIPSLAAVGHWSVSALRRHDPTALAGRAGAAAGVRAAGAPRAQTSAVGRRDRRRGVLTGAEALRDLDALFELARAA